MKAVHRVLVAGAFGGLAAAMIAGGGAFACTATSSVWISGAGAAALPNPVTAGTVIDVHIDDFYATGVGTVSAGEEVVSEVTITWLFPAESDLGPWSGPVLGSIPVPAWTSDNGPTVIQQFTIPEVRPSVRAHYVRAEQTVNNVPIFARTFPVSISDGSTRPTIPPTIPPTPSSTMAPETTAAPTTVATTKDTPGTPLVTTRPTPRAQTGGSQAGVGRIRTFARPDAPFAVSSPEAPARDQATSPAGPSSLSPQVPLADERQEASSPALAADDLWSGLQSGPSHSLVDPVPSSPNGSNPVGGVLLGAGLVALAGAAAAAGRRRLAMVRTTR